MRRFMPATLGLVLTLSWPAWAAPTLLQADSRIRAVTVYPDCAQVTRVARLDVTPGTYAVRFDRLPISLQPDSVRVRGDGTAKAVIQGFELRSAFLGRSPDKEVAALENKLLAFGDRDRTLADQRAIHERQLTVLKDTAAQSGDSLAKQLAAGKAKLADWHALMAFYQTQQSQETRALQQIDQDRRALANQRKGVEIQLAKLRGFRHEQVRQVPVIVEVKEGGTLNLALDYVMPGARWFPIYDARLTPAGDRLDLGAYGMISQQTGEDWSDVQLKLSTAQPEAGGQPPELPDWFLSPWRPRPMPKGAAAPMASAARELAKSAEDNAQFMPMQEAVVQVESQGSSVTLEVPRLMSVPSDGEAHQAPIGHAQLPAKPSYVSVPKFAPAAYLQVATTHTGPWPLLMGPVKAFVGQDYVGTSQLSEEISPEQAFELAMGTDRAVQVQRKRLSKQQGQTGLLQKVQFAEYTYEIAVTNQKPGAQTLTLVEPLPQSTAQEVKVQLLDTNYRPLAESEPGQVRWQLKLAPHEKKVLRWGYRVEYPLGTQLNGLE